VIQTEASAKKIAKTPKSDFVACVSTATCYWKPLKAQTGVVSYKIRMDVSIIQLLSHTSLSEQFAALMRTSAATRSVEKSSDSGVEVLRSHLFSIETWRGKAHMQPPSSG
jgi:hypothetical protein